MKNVNVLEGIDEIFAGIKERLDLLPNLHRDVIEMSFGLDGGGPMNCRDIAFELRGEYIDLTPEIVGMVQTDGLRMLRLVDKRNDWTGSTGKDYDPGKFPHLSWNALDLMHSVVGHAADKTEDIREYLRKRYADSDYVVIPTLRDLYEYNGDATVFQDDTVKPSAGELEELKEYMADVVEILEEMGKIPLPNKKVNGSCAPTILDYSYLDMETAVKIVLSNPRLVNS